MIPKQERVKVYSNSSNEKGFTINASPEAFRILSSGLYSNKIRAIIRELSCNAYDSHVMAGTPERPFKIHLPDAWEPFFSVEDFGIGLDDEDVDNIYTSYFTSTKTDSNSTIGGLGLGSKTPFSYTDTFTVRTRKDSVERVYSAYISEAGSPTVSLMTETDTTEPNGVMVTVPVKSADFYSFQREAKIVFEYFGVLPEINLDNIDNSIVRKLSHSGIVVNGYGNSGKVTAVMGNVAYNIDINETILPKTYDKVWRFLEHSSLTIRFDIGDLSVAASRETISFDNETKQAFTDKIDQITNEYYKQFQDHLDQTYDHVIDAMMYADKELGEWSRNLLTFNGQPLVDYEDCDFLDEIRQILDPNDDGKEVFTLYRAGRGSSTTKVIFDDASSIYYKNVVTNRVIFSFVMDDTEHHRGFDRTCRDQYKSSRDIRYVIGCPRVLTKDEQEKIYDLLGCRTDDTFHLLTNLKEKFKVVREKTKVIRPKADPVQRVKKNEIRLECFVNNESTIHTSAGIYMRRLDIDELSKKRVGIIETNRGSYEDTILKTSYISHNTVNAIIVSKIFELDYILFVRPSRYEKIKEKMPFVLEVKNFTWKDVKDNDFGFAHTFVKKSGNQIRDFKKALDNDTKKNWLNNELFNTSKRCAEIKYTQLAKLIKSVSKLDIPDLVYKDRSEPMRKKLEHMFSKMTSAEINACYTSSALVTFSNDNPWFKMVSQHVDQIGSDSIADYESVAEKYPLLKMFSDTIDSLEPDEENKDDPYKIYIGHINDYIKMVNDLEQTNTLYKKAA